MAIGVPPYDHSQTYKKISFRNIGHIFRAREIFRAISAMPIPSAPTYFDVGCSNGYFTARIGDRIGAQSVVGWDHSQPHIDAARQLYPHLEFRLIDLNAAGSRDEKADIVTCFEVLEHVGDVDAALDNLIEMTKPSGTVFITVPIEAGAIGAVKFLIKTRMLGYRLDELSKDSVIQRTYLWDVIRGRDISRFRSSRQGWGTHFGFDYRPFELEVKSRLRSVRAWTVGTTRFLVGIR
jgi:SAM-dependent methyltransferase